MINVFCIVPRSVAESAAFSVLSYIQDNIIVEYNIPVIYRLVLINNYYFYTGKYRVYWGISCECYCHCAM